MDIVVVFSVMAIEALVTEQALLAVDSARIKEKEFNDAKNTGGMANKIQALLDVSQGQSLNLTGSVGIEFEHLVTLRNGLVHYEVVPRPALRKTLRALVGKGLCEDQEQHEWPFGWPDCKKPGVAMWAAETTRDVAMEISSLLVDPVEASVTRNTFSL